MKQKQKRTPCSWFESFCNIQGWGFVCQEEERIQMDSRSESVIRRKARLVILSTGSPLMEGVCAGRRKRREQQGSERTCGDESE